MKREKLEKIVEFSPAFDKRNPEPTKNYGIGAMTCRMILKGKGLAVQFVFSTGIYTKNITNELELDKRWIPKAMGYDVGYHSLKPMYKGQTKCRVKCEYLNGKSCYYDGSSLRAEEYLEVFIEKGDKEIWKKLKTEYYSYKRSLNL